jgi:cytosine deaminase
LDEHDKEDFTMFDLLIKNGTLATTGDRADVAVKDGRIARIASGIEGDAAQTIDAGGKLVSMGFIDAHIHADKALVADRVGERLRASRYTDHITSARKFKESFTVEDIRQRAARVFKMAAANGTTTIRTQVELDPIVGTATAEGVLQAMKDCASIIDVQTVSFPQEGWASNELELDCQPWVRKGLEMGLHYIGGNMNPSWPSDIRTQIDDVFRIAGEYGVGVDIHLDNVDSAVGHNLPHVARRTREYGLEGRVTVSHLVGLAHVPDQLAERAMQAAKEADITVCSLPGRIRLTPIPTLMEYGINVTIGTDNMQDYFTGLGRADMLEMSLLLARVLKHTRPGQMQKIYETITTNGAKNLELEGELGLEEGKQADLVIVDAASVHAMIRDTSTRLYVIKRGKIVAQNGQLV